MTEPKLVLDRNGKKLWNGDVIATLRLFPSESVQMCVTSPPYWGLRSYRTSPIVWGGADGCEHEWAAYSEVRDSGVGGNWQQAENGPGLATGKPQTRFRGDVNEAARRTGLIHVTSGTCRRCGAWRGELGSEPTVELYVEHIVEVFREVRRVLRSDGTLWLNIGDSYHGGDRGKGDGARVTAGTLSARNQHADNYLAPNRMAQVGLKPKDLCLIPERLALALQADGWYVRSRIAWCLSGGTQVYVRSQKGDMSMSVRDMTRLDPASLQVWNGERWTRVLRMWESTDDADPIEIELRSGERIGCTPGHLWPTERGLLPARSLCVGDGLKRVRLPEPEIPRKPSALDEEDVGWFVGLYLAEGFPSTHSIGIASHIRETERFERVARIAQAFDGSATMRRNQGNAATITVYGRILRAIIEEYVFGKGAHGKHLTNACWRRSDVFLRGLLDGYLHGDGHWEEKNQRWRLNFARNYEFAADLRTLCARLGVSLRLRPRAATLNGRQFPTFRGEIRFTKSGSPYEKSDDEIVAIGFSRGRKFWDIEVEDEPHTFALASGVLTHNCKTSAMPESVTDRPSSAWEHIWLLSKSARYFWDAEAVRQPAIHEGKLVRASGPGARNALVGDEVNDRRTAAGFTNHDTLVHGANLRNFWLLGPDPFPGAHFATFSRKLVEICVKAGSSERGCCSECGAPWVRVVERGGLVGKDRGGNYRGYVIPPDVRRNGGTPGLSYENKTTGWRPGCSHDAPTKPCVVLDCFAGSGTTLLVANQLGREAWGVELSEPYCELAIRRLQQDSLMALMGG